MLVTPILKILPDWVISSMYYQRQPWAYNHVSGCMCVGRACCPSSFCPYCCSCGPALCRGAKSQGRHKAINSARTTVQLWHITSFSGPLFPQLKNGGNGTFLGSVVICAPTQGWLTPNEENAYHPFLISSVQSQHLTCIYIQLPEGYMSWSTSHELQ